MDKIKSAIRCAEIAQSVVLNFYKCSMAMAKVLRDADKECVRAILREKYNISPCNHSKSSLNSNNEK